MQTRKRSFTKRLLSGLVAVMMLLSLLPTAAFAAEPADWNVDEEAKTVAIYTAEGLRAWADSVEASNAKYDGYTISIENDIDLDGQPWASIISLGGTVTIDGKNHVISNMSISEQENGSGGNTYLGFIGNLNYNAKLTVKDLTFQNAHVQDLSGDGEYSWCGVVVGHGPMDGVSESQAECTFTNVSIINSVVTGGHNNGAIMGYSCSTERGILFENCKVTDTFVGGYNSTSGILFGMGIANVTVRDCYASGVRLYTDGLNFDCSQSWDKQLWLGNVYPEEIYGDRYGSNGTATYEGTNTAEDTFVVYPVLYHYADGDVSEYVQVNTPLSGAWYTDADHTIPVTQITADLTDDDMYPYNKQSIANTQTYDTQNVNLVANPLTHAAIELYSPQTKPDKTSYPGLTKEVQDNDQAEDEQTQGWGTSTGAADGEIINFRLTSNVPQDLINYLEPETPAEPGIATMSEPNSGHYILTFHDVMDDHLAFDADSVAVTIGDEPLNAQYYTVRVPGTEHGEGEDAETCTFEIELDLAELYEANIIDDDDIAKAASIVVTYSAKLTLGEDEFFGTYPNTAWVVYEGGETEESVVNVRTYAIDIFKYDQSTDSQEGLAGAQFDLYTQLDEDGDPVEDSKVNTEPYVSGDDGHVTIGGLDDGTYYLVEAKAPDGYVQSKTPLNITIAGGAPSVSAIQVRFANSPIPHTGGMGTTMYTVGGVAILALGGALFVLNRKKLQQA